MPVRDRLSALAVKNARYGKHYDGDGLFLRVDKNDTGRWVFRFRLHGRRREMGLGPRGAVSLKDARRERDRWRSVVAVGCDPIHQREKEARERAMDRPTLATVAAACLEARKASLKGGGVAGRWLSPITLHILPRLGTMPIEDVTQNHIRDALEPIWQDKAETARKAMNRLGLVMKHAAAMGLDVDLQATMKAKALLGAQKHKARHIEAMPWREVPAFFDTLVGGGIVAECLALTMLTVVRSGAVRTARWENIDLKAKVWTVPADVMKGQEGQTEDFRVPLSEAAIAVLERVKPVERDGWVFPSTRKGCVSDMAMGMHMRRQGMDYRPHGFRSGFRDWCEDAGIDYVVAETCMAHIIGSKVERAYRRDDLLEKRRVTLHRWSDHCLGKSSAKVLTLAGNG